MRVIRPEVLLDSKSLSFLAEYDVHLVLHLLYSRYCWHTSFVLWGRDDILDYRSTDKQEFARFVNRANTDGRGGGGEHLEAKGERNGSPSSPTPSARWEGSNFATVAKKVYNQDIPVRRILQLQMVLSSVARSTFLNRYTQLDHLQRPLTDAISSLTIARLEAGGVCRCGRWQSHLKIR